LIILQPTSPLRNLQVVKSAIYDFCLNNLESSIGVHLASENPIFSQFIKDISDDIRVEQVKSIYDTVLGDEEFEKLISSKF
jgi:CMP-N-acetylneuraminic acid synthetase